MASEEKQGEKVTVPRTAAERQRIKLEKLMKNPNKPVVIPEPRDPKLPRVFNPPEFIRNIWGSSAGAGSGDFHVYRGVRRREYARQKFLDEKAVIDQKAAEYKKRVEANQKEAQARTAKKRAKRQQKKARRKAAKKPKVESKEDSSEDSDSDSEESKNEEVPGGKQASGTFDAEQTSKSSGERTQKANSDDSEEDSDRDETGAT